MATRRRLFQLALDPDVRARVEALVGARPAFRTLSDVMREAIHFGLDALERELRLMREVEE